MRCKLASAALRSTFRARNVDMAKPPTPQQLQVMDLLDSADCDVFAGSHLVAHVILKDDANLTIKVFEIVFAQTDAIQQDLAFHRIVEASHQLDDRRLAFAIFTDERDPLAGTQMKIQSLQNQARSPRIVKRNIAKLESLLDRARHGQCVGLGFDGRTHFEECDEIGEEQSLIGDGGERRKSLLQVRAGVSNGIGQES